MLSVVFIGTFDPLHGAHLGQLLRAHHYKSFTKAFIIIDKHPSHKPHAADWLDRLNMAKLTLGSIDLPFDYELMAVESSRASELKEKIDYKISGIDSLLDNLSDRNRWALACRWPMIVLSVPGIEEQELNSAIALLPADIKKKIKYLYVDTVAVPGMNYDFEKQTFMFRRIHATYIRAGKESSLIPHTVRSYIEKHNLYTQEWEK